MTYKIVYITNDDLNTVLDKMESTINNLLLNGWEIIGSLGVVMIGRAYHIFREMVTK